MDYISRGLLRFTESSWIGYTSRPEKIVKMVLIVRRTSSGMFSFSSKIPFITSFKIVVLSRAYSLQVVAETWDSSLPPCWASIWKGMTMKVGWKEKEIKRQIFLLATSSGGTATNFSILVWQNLRTILSVYRVQIEYFQCGTADLWTCLVQNIL